MLQKTSVKGLILMTLLLFPLSGMADDWEFVAVPYGLLPSISGDASLGRVDGADVDVSGGAILKALGFGAMSYLQGLNKSWCGALINYGFM